MQYAEYRKKMIKLKNALGVLKRFRVLIICACLLVVALVTTLLSVRGIVYEVSSCPQEIVYGDNLGFKAKAVMGGVKYQYSADGENWSSVQPVRAGSYKVRPYSKDVSGKTRYGKEHAFIIRPKQIEVRAADYAVYGENPELIADLSFEDRIYCSEFDFGDRYAETTEVTPEKTAVVIADKNGGDVTSSYVITTVKTEITLGRRAVTVAAASAEKEYDGTPLTADGHEFRNNTSLANGDTISYAGCEGSRTEAGEGQNEIAGEIKIYNERGEDVSDRYEVTTAYGALTVERRKVAVNSENAEKEYDGEPLSCLEFSDDGRLLSGHSLQVSAFTRLTDAGEKDNALGFRVAGVNGKDESANYEILLNAGTLTVTRRKVTVTTEDMSWTYDGTAHSCAEFYDTDGAVADDEEIIATAISSITDVGSTENVCEMRAYNYKTKTDTTANYDITVLYGTLTVTEAQLTIYSEDYDWVYDGSAHGWNGYEQEGLAEIHTIVSTAVSKITDVGTRENEIEVKVYSGSSEVTANYDIEYIWGQLEITPRPVTVKADDAEKIYDGESLTCDTVSADNLAPGHTVSGEATGSRIDAGEGESAVVRWSVVIRDGDGKDVTSNYDINLANGVLKVNPRPLTVTTESFEKIYDGEPLSSTSYRSYKITSNLSPAYINGHSVKIESYTEIVDAGSLPNELTVKFYDHQKDVTENYEITYVYGTLKITPRPITVKTYSAGGHIYDGTPFKCEKYELTSSLSPALVKDHCEQVTFTGKQIDAGTAKNTAEVKVFTADEVDVTKNYGITVIEGDLYVAKRDVTIISYGGEWEYDGAPHSRNAYRVSDEKGYGLAAGDAVEILSVTEIVDAGSAQNVIAIKINCASRGKEVTANYNISYERGVLTVTKRPVTVIADSAEKVYDGTPLVCGTVGSNNKPVVVGHKVSARTTGSQTVVGESANRVVQGTVAIYDANGVNVTKNYQITLGEGVLKVTQRAITVKAGDAEKIYDGDPLTCSVYAVVSEDKLLSGHSLTATTSGSLTNAGEGANYILPSTVKITDRSGADVTSSYTVNTEDGVLTVTKRPITVIADSAEKEYDGTPLTCDGYKVFSIHDPALVKDHSLTAVVSGSQTAAGSGINSVESVVITSASGDVTANYAIAVQNGTLTVKGKKLTVTTESGEFTYDGEAHYFPEFTYDGLLEGHTITNTLMYAFRSAGEFNNPATIEITDGDEDVTYCYDIAYVFGTVTVKKREVHVTTADGEWVYDGTPHTAEYAEVDSDSPYGLVEGHEFTYSDCAEIITVGEASNKLVSGVSEGEYDRTSNYDLHLTFGALKVTKRPVTLTYRYDEIYFTGAPLNKSVTCSYYSYFESVSEYPLLGGTYVTVTVLCDEYGLGAAILYFQEGSARITDYNEKDLTKNYEITLQSKQVSIEKREIRLQSVETEKVYDGTPLTAEQYIVDDSAASDNPFISYSLISGHELCDVELTFTGSQTEIGESLNTFTVDSFKVVDAEGNDITYGYTVEVRYGGLYVTEFGSLYIKTSGASKIYDGTPLTNNKYNFKSTLLEGYTYEITVTGSQTEVGCSANTFEVVVYSPQGDDVTEGLRLVTVQLGTLAVLEKEPHGNSGVGDLDLSGSIGGGGLGGVAGDENTVALKLYSEYGGQAYMRLMSYGDYTGDGWNPANPYTETIDGKYGMNYLTGFALGGAGKQSYKMQVEVMGSMYYLPYYLASGDYDYEVQQSDVLYSGDTSVIYSMYYYPYNYLADGAVSVNSNFKEAELAYRQFVYDNYLAVPQSTAEYLETVIAAQGFDINDKNVVGKIAAFVQNCATYNLNYNTALDSESDGVVSFLRDYKEGVCRHYASAATLLYRMIGIPARYTVGYAGETVEGEWVEITVAKAHAWVEIYVDGMGWVQIEVTGSPDGGGNNEVIDLGKLIPADVTKEYDGTPLVANRLAVTPALAEILEKGYTVRAQYGGSQTNVGVSYSWVTGVAVYDPDGKPVLNNVKWTTGTGLLKVVRSGSLITVHLYYLGCEYDGKGHSLGKDDWYAEGLPAGFGLEFDPSSIVVTAANGFNWDAVKALPLKLYNASGYEVTSNYNIIFSCDSAEGSDGEGIDISRRQITVCTQTAEKEYDGTPLKNRGWWISFGTLAQGHRIDVEVKGSITDVGVALNDIGGCDIYDADGNDVSRNYQLTFKRGTLTVID